MSDERRALADRLAGDASNCNCRMCDDLRAAAAALREDAQERTSLTGDARTDLKMVYSYELGRDEMVAERDAALAEVARLKAEADREEAATLRVIDERDRAEEWADKLAFALGGAGIGEHSSMNNPWQNALDNPCRVPAGHVVIDPADIPDSVLMTLRAMCDPYDTPHLEPSEHDAARIAARLLTPEAP